MPSQAIPITRIFNVEIFDGHDKLPGTYTVTIVGEVIESVDVFDPSQPVAGEGAIDGAGKTLLPGLIDAHTHVFNALESIKNYVPAGVTTIMDMHNERDYATFMKAHCKASKTLPDLLSAFSAATVKDGWSRPIMKRSHATPEVLDRITKWPELDSRESVEQYIQLSKELGADFVKLFQESGDCLNFGEIPAPSESLQTMIIDIAHQNGLRTVAHATNLRETLLVLQAGVDGLAHQCFDRPQSTELIDHYRKSGAYLIPTLVAVNSFTGTQSSAGFSRDKRVDRVLDSATRRCLCSGMNTALPYCNVQWAYDNVRALHKAGVDIVCGTDTGPGFPGTSIGLSTHHELWMYVEECGLSPVEALRTATSVPARRYHLLDRGRVMPGLRADLLLVQGDPTQNVRQTLDILGVWRQGFRHPHFA